MTAAWSAEPHSAAPSDGALRVLVVEDCCDSAKNLENLLQAWNCSVRTSVMGAHALPQAGEFNPDVAIVSLSLPDMCGFEVAHELRQGAKAGRLLLISLSYPDQQRERMRANALGFDFHLIKPVAADEFHRALVQIAAEYGLPAVTSSLPWPAASDGIHRPCGASPGASGSLPAVNVSPAPHAIAPLRLLLVDQDRGAARGLANWLRQWGHDVKVCLSAEEALEDVDAFSPHVIVIETIGLDADAKALAASLREREHLTHPRLIALVEPGCQISICDSPETGFDVQLSGTSVIRQLKGALMTFWAAETSAAHGQ